MSSDVDPAIVNLVETAVMGRRARRVGAEVAFLCPAHADRTPSAMWHPKKAVWHCHVCDAKGGAIDLANRLGIQLPERDRMERQVAATYIYYDEQNQAQYRVIRTQPKGFYQQRLEGGEWVNGMNGVRRILYRLPEVLSRPDEPVLVVEGEKDVDRLWAQGFVATCNVGGAGKWQREYSQALAGREVIVIPDDDEPGMKHAQHIIDATPGARLLPAIEGKDISEWFDTGGTAEALRALLSQRPERAYQTAEFFLTQSPDDHRPVPTGYRDLDRLLSGGVRPGQLLFLAARPGVGKSALAAGMAWHAARAGFPAGLLSLEMSGYEIARRLRQYGPWEPGTIFIDEAPSQTIETVEQRARELVADGVQIILVDYVQLMDDGGDNRVLGLGKISRGLKKLSKELHIPVVGLCQLNRGIEQRSDRRFKLSDLRESGNLEQDADIVAFLDREELYAEDCVRGSASIDVQKHRNGATATLPLGFHAPTARFYDFQEWQPDWHPTPTDAGPNSWDAPLSNGGKTSTGEDSVEVHEQGVLADGTA